MNKLKWTLTLLLLPLVAGCIDVKVIGTPTSALPVFTPTPSVTIDLDATVEEAVAATLTAVAQTFVTQEPEVTPTPQPTNAPTVTLEEQATVLYFPIAEGSHWEYLIRIPEGGQYLTFKRLRFSEHDIADEVRGIASYAKKGGDFKLQYVVGPKASKQGSFEFKDGWALTVVEDELGLYEDVNEVFWIRAPSRERDVLEVRLYDKSVAERVLPNLFHQMGPESLDFLFFYDSSSEDLEIEIQGQSLRYLQRSESVSVQAGDFQDCVILKKTVDPSDEITPGFLPSYGWQTLLWFCPGVGLVKSEQRDHEGTLLNWMELVSYQVK